MMIGIDEAIIALKDKASEYRLIELLLCSSSRFKRQPNLDALYEAESLEQVSKWLEELKESRIKLQKIEEIAREAFNNPDTANIDLYRAQKLADIFAIFEYDGATIGLTSKQDQDHKEQKEFAGQMDIYQAIEEAEREE
jgi:hypothetical protein